MCGIAGIFSLDLQHTVDVAVLERMANVLAHRGPDDSGVFIDGPVGLAHRRLSIIDISGGAQPMADPSGRVWISYNGEVYNFRELAQELAAKGHRLQTHSDTEVVLHAYLEWGDSCVERFNGMFAFAIWDGRRQRLFAARDRLGIKPFFWTMIDGQFVFASEVKGISQHPGFRAHPNVSAISSYLTFRQPIWHLCFYEGVNKLLPGHVISVTADGTKTAPYWELPMRTHGAQDNVDEAREQAGALLDTAVRRRMVSDVPLGAYLSGGLDSSLVVAMMSRASSVPVNSFSIGYEDEGYDEGAWAQMVADHVGAKHQHVVLPSTDYMGLWTQLVRQKDAPISIPHEIALYQLSVELKKSVTVALSGEGADELFGGYGRVQRSPMDWKKVAAIRAMIGGAAAERFGRGAARQNQLRSHLACETHMDHFFHVYNWVPMAEKMSLLSGDARAAVDGDAEVRKVFGAIFSRSGNDVDSYDAVLHAFQKIHLGCLLDRLDTMSMAAGVEARVPFVDHELVEHVVQLPTRLKMRWNSPLSRFRALFHTSFVASEWLDTSKVMLRELGDELLPREISRRKKLGFPTPLDRWLEGGMLDLAKDLLLDGTARSRGIFDPGAIESLLSNAQSLPYDFYGKKIWMLMNVETWLRECVDGGPRECVDGGPRECVDGGPRETIQGPGPDQGTPSVATAT